MRGGGNKGPMKETRLDGTACHLKVRDVHVPKKGCEVTQRHENPKSTGLVIAVHAKAPQGVGTQFDIEEMHRREANKHTGLEEGLSERVGKVSRGM